MRQTDIELVTTLKKVVGELSTMIRLYSGETPDVLHENHPEVADKVIRRVCLQCGKTVSLEEKYRRGLCQRCYQATNRKLAAHSITEEKLIASGLITAEKDPGGRKRERTALDDLVEKAGDEFRRETFENSKAVVQKETKKTRKKKPKHPGS